MELKRLQPFSKKTEEKGKIIYLPCNSNIGKANKEAWKKNRMNIEI